MFRSRTNPPSRFEEVQVTYDEDAPPARLRVYEDHTRSILSKNDSPDLPFTWSLNPYRGCSHACAYCYARPTHEYLGWGAGTDFDSRILVKPDAPELLAEAFDNPRWAGELILFSGNTDCYQPLEVRHGLTRACLEVCLRYRNPVSVITKSNLVERDVGLLAELAATVGTHVTISLPFFDPELARAIEPGAPTPARRLRAIRTLSEAGISVGVNIAPVIPGLNDREIPAVLEAAREAGARRAGMILVRLPGPVEPWFTAQVRDRLPTRAEGVLSRIRRARHGALNDPRFGERMHGSGPEWELTEQLFARYKARLGYEEHAAEPRPTPFRRPGAGIQLGLWGGETATSRP